VLWRFCTKAFAVFAVLKLVVPAPAFAAETYALYFPARIGSPIDQRIEAIKLTIACGHVRAISAIPYDWTVLASSAVSEEEKLSLDAGHGASMLPDLKTLDGVILIEKRSASCFKLAGTVYVSIRGEERSIPLRQDQLKLVRARSANRALP
jgi:hypothetical protein